MLSNLYKIFEWDILVLVVVRGGVVPLMMILTCPLSQYITTAEDPYTNVATGQCAFMFTSASVSVKHVPGVDIGRP